MWCSNLKKKIFLDISSTNIDTIVPLLYQGAETRSVKVFWLLSQLFPRLCFNLLRHKRNVCHQGRNFSTQLWTTLRTNTSHRKKGKISLWIFFALSHFSHWKTHNRTLLFGNTLHKYGHYFDHWNQPLYMAHARLLPRLSWSWTVLLPSDTDRKPITSITAVLLPFVTYLLTPSYVCLYIKHETACSHGSC
jgi:hypothetical protein